jgi:hypothetical protein
MEIPETFIKTGMGLDLTTRDTRTSQMDNQVLKEVLELVPDLEAGRDLDLIAGERVKIITIL